jgi:peptide/nickel transport system permease protein
MLRYALARLLLTAALLLGLTLVVYLIGAVTPGDPVEILLGEGAPPGEVARLRSQLGLDLPWYLQYPHYVARLLQGDLGLSYRSRLPVAEEVFGRLPATLELTLAAIGLAVAIGLPLGLLAALRPRRALDRLAIGLAVAGSSAPVFWSGLLFILLFSVTLGWLPASGRDGPLHLVLPALVLGLSSAGLIARLARSSLLDIVSQDYIRTARSKGLPERRVVSGHALRNALVPLAAVIGLQLGGLLGGAVLTETVFAWPGLGRLTVQAIEQRDFPIVRGAVLLAGVVYSVVNVGLDLLFASLDPRIRYR